MGESDKLYLKSLITKLSKEDKDDKQYYNMVYNVLIKYIDVLDKDEMITYINDYKYRNATNNEQFFNTYINNKVRYKYAIEIFTKNLKRYMELRGKTVTDLSRDLKISYSTVNDWYNGKNYPRPSKIGIIADYLQVSSSNLTEENVNTNKSNVIPVLGTIPARYTY